MYYFDQTNTKENKSVLMNIYEVSKENYRLQIPLNIDEASPITILEYPNKSTDTLQAETRRLGATIFINRIMRNRKVAWTKNESILNELTEIIIQF